MTQTRKFSEFTEQDPEVKLLLDDLVDPSVGPERYRTLMKELGAHLGQCLLPALLEKNLPVCVVCTVEDADYLASGLIDILEQSQALHGKTNLLCIWNEKLKQDGLSVTPISRQYKEPLYSDRVVYVIVKSIIASACVVKTNLTRALSINSADDIFVVSPVLLEGAQERLALEFPNSISDKFKYVWFATDFEIRGEEVVPGIGGSVYERLGFENENDKNRHVPLIVKERRKTRQSPVKQYASAY